MRYYSICSTPTLTIYLYLHNMYNNVYGEYILCEIYNVINIQIIFFTVYNLILYWSLHFEIIFYLLSFLQKNNNINYEEKIA